MMLNKMCPVLLSKTLLILLVCLGQNAKADNHNLSSNPVGSVIGFSNLEYSYKTFEHLTVGITGYTGKLKIGDVDFRADSFGAVARLYLKPAFEQDSVYLVATVNQQNYEAIVSSSGTRFTAKGDEVVSAGGAGYHWFWESFNINVAGLFSNRAKVELKDSVGNKYKDDVMTGVDFEFNIGWKF